MGMRGTKRRSKLCLVHLCTVRGEVLSDLCGRLLCTIATTRSAPCIGEETEKSKKQKPSEIALQCSFVSLSTPSGDRRTEMNYTTCFAPAMSPLLLVDIVHAKTPHHVMCMGSITIRPPSLGKSHK